jgi:hypothetical protein
MHILAVSLLAILAGTLLLAKFRKEAAGRFFICVSWFFIVVGCLLFLGAIGFGVCRMSHCCKSGDRECRQEMIMKGCPGEMKEGMMHKGFCAPGHECRRPCMPARGCMKGDTTMKCCAKNTSSDSTKALPPKTH